MILLNFKFVTLVCSVCLTVLNLKVPRTPLPYHPALLITATLRHSRTPPSVTRILRRRAVRADQLNRTKAPVRGTSSHTDHISCTIEVKVVIKHLDPTTVVRVHTAAPAAVALQIALIPSQRWTSVLREMTSCCSRKDRAMKMSPIRMLQMLDRIVTVLGFQVFPIMF